MSLQHIGLYQEPETIIVQIVSVNVKTNSTSILFGETECDSSVFQFYF